MKNREEHDAFKYSEETLRTEYRANREYLLKLRLGLKPEKTNAKIDGLLLEAREKIKRKEL